MIMSMQHQSIPYKKTVKRHLLPALLCLGLGMSVSIAASAKNPNPPSLRQDAPHVYIVKKGDTLWDISGRFLQRPWRWPEIWASNRHVKNPHWIYPGDRLLLCTLDGKPLIGKDEGDGCEGIIRRAGGINLTPQVRIESLNNAIPVIPLEHIKVWLERSILVSPDAINDVPYVLGMAENRVIAARGDRIYIRGNGIETGQRYGVYRLGEPYQLPDANGKLQNVAVELTQVASGLSTQQQNGISTLELNKTYNAEVRKGDLVMPEYDAMLPTLFYPVPAKTVRENGEVIRVLGSINRAGKHDVIAVDRGTQDGAAVGQVFAIDQKGAITTDPKTQERVQLPSQRIGHALVFKTFDRFSYAYVTDSTLPIELGAKLAVPMSDE